MKKPKGDVLKNWQRIKDHLKLAEDALRNKNADNLILFTWLAAENLINSLKMQINGSFTTSHAKKATNAKRLYAMGVLRRDYSDTIGKLTKLRLLAEHHPYTHLQEQYTLEEAKQYFQDIKSLFKEVETILKQRNVVI